MLSNVSLSFTRFATRNLLSVAQKVVTEQVRPLLRMQGADLTVKSIEGGVLKCKFSGDYLLDSSRKETLKYSVLPAVQSVVPEIWAVAESVE